MGFTEQMTDFLVQHQTLLRFGAFAGLLVMFSLLEALFERKARSAKRLQRWPGAFGLFVVGGVVSRLLVAGITVGAAGWASAHHVGLLNWAQPLAPLFAWMIAIVALDLAIWAQHLAMHAVPVLWRLHRVHHSDIDIDAMTAIRFHPIEIVLSLLYKAAIIAALGAPVGAVILYEITLNAMALFNHANLRLPPWLDRLLRAFIVTPDFHRVHHSVEMAETNSNYGNLLSFWDGLFGQYRAEPKAGHARMTIGLEAFRDRHDLLALMIQPFKNALR